MHFICIGGLWITAERMRSENSMWTPLRRELHADFPGSTSVVEELEYLRLRDYARASAWADHIVEMHAAARDIVLIGHSAGGEIAVAIAKRIQAVAIVTLCSPHRLPMRVLVPKTDEEPDIPILTFGASWRDYVVPPVLTRHRRSIAHRMLRSNHWRDIANNPALAREIVAEIRKHLFPQT